MKKKLLLLVPALMLAACGPSSKSSSSEVPPSSSTGPIEPTTITDWRDETKDKMMDVLGELLPVAPVTNMYTVTVEEDNFGKYLELLDYECGNIVEDYVAEIAKTPEYVSAYDDEEYAVFYKDLSETTYIELLFGYDADMEVFSIVAGVITAEEPYAWPAEVSQLLETNVNYVIPVATFVGDVTATTITADEITKVKIVGEILDETTYEFEVNLFIDYFDVVEEFTDENDLLHLVARTIIDTGYVFVEFYLDNVDGANILTIIAWFESFPEIDLLAAELFPDANIPVSFGDFLFIDYGDENQPFLWLFSAVDSDTSENFINTFTDSGWEFVKEYDDYFGDTYTVLKSGNCYFEIAYSEYDGGLYAVMYINPITAWHPEYFEIFEMYEIRFDLVPAAPLTSMNSIVWGMIMDSYSGDICAEYGQLLLDKGYELFDEIEEDDMTYYIYSLLADEATDTYIMIQLSFDIYSAMMVIEFLMV